MLLERYRLVRMARLENAAKRLQIEAMLLLSGLQQRLRRPSPERLSQIQFSLAMRPSFIASQVNQPARLNLMRWRSTLLTG